MMSKNLLCATPVGMVNVHNSFSALSDYMVNVVVQWKKTLSSALVMHFDTHFTPDVCLMIKSHGLCLDRSRNMRAANESLGGMLLWN
ncbi:hypothetical protein MUK42_17529 [Musa troglodytarum]|uniref:Uncharacterized protein n=1 Tax=Musa troglodytarum TaxID=320322 RepID=A0A9E7HTI7_9LILI|nr:hypothetical protein MUK42_17529 [Musa troglodytarum]